MASSNLVSVLCSLCEMEPPEVTGQGIEESANRNALATLFELGALLHVGNSESALCFGCDHPHSIAVEYAGDGQYRGYCADTGYQPFRPEDIRRLAVAEDWIVQAIRSSLSLNPGGHSVQAASSAVSRIGRVRFGSYPCELFFGRRLFERARFDEAKRTIAGAIGKAPAILLTTTPSDLIPGEPPPRCAIVALEDVLTVTTGQVSLDDGPFYAALRGGDHRFHADGVGFVFSPGFRSAVFGDLDYSFSDKQAQVVEALYEAWRTGNPRLHQTEIQGKAHTSQRVGQVFAGHPAYGALIKYDGAGYYWLDL